MIGLYLPSAPSLSLCFGLSFCMLDVVRANYVIGDILSLV